MNKLKTFIFICLWTSVVQAQTNNDIRTKTVTIGFTKEPLREALFALGRASGFQFVFFSEQVDATKTVDLPRVERTVEATLNLLLQGSNLEFQVQESTIVLSEKKESPPVATVPAQQSQSASQNQQITGRVISNSVHEPMPFVTVAIKGTTTGVTTSLDGDFTITVPSANAVLVFSFMGYETLELPVVVGRRMDVRMNATATTLEAVVITGYQTLRPHEVAGATTTLVVEDILQGGVATLDRMLQGAAGGMMVNLASGEPGETAQIRIRGNATLSSNAAPLWVVDGVILEQPVPFEASDINSPDAAYLIGNAISGLNPEDIETITILRDASATAIYGVRAANGVIVITTRKGAAGPARVEYSGSFSFKQPRTYRNFDRMNSAERVKLSREIVDARLRYENIPTGITYEGAMRMLMNKEITQTEFEEMVMTMQMRNTDWFKELSRSEVTQNHRIAVSGGTEATRYFFSAGYSDEKSGTIGSSGERFNTLAKLNANFGGWLDVEVQTRYSLRQSTGYNGVNPFDYAYTTTRTMPLFNDDGTFHRHMHRNGRLYNIMEELENTGRTGHVEQVESLLSLGAKIWRNLGYRGTFAYNTSNSRQRSWATDRSNHVARIRGYDFGAFDETAGSYWNSVLPVGGIMEKSDNHAVSWTIRNALDFRETFRRDHSINALAAVELRQNKHVGDASTGYGWLPIFGEIFMPVYTDNFVGSYVRRGLLNIRTTNRLSRETSFIGTFGYGYRGRYMFNASIRSDGSNRFGSDPKYRWLPTWMVSGRWNMDNENFIRNNAKWVNSLALRISYGVQGNIHEQLTPDLIVRFDTRDSRSGADVYRVDRLPNPELRWEKSSSWNGGLDFTILNHRLKGSIDAYYRFTEDLITNRTVPTNTGRSQLAFNAGEMINRGIEGSIQYTIINRGDWIFRSGANFGRNINWVVLADGDAFSNREQLNMLLRGDLAVEGAPVGAMYSFRFAGLSPENGYPLFYAEDGTRVGHMGIPTLFDLVYSGSTFPSLFGGFDFSVDYKRMFSLSLGFTYNLGNVKRLPSIYEDGERAFDPLRNFSVRQLDRWRQPGDETHTNLPVFYNRDVVSSTIVHSPLNIRPIGSTGYLTAPYFYDRSDLQVARADFLKFRSIRLTYTMPRETVKKMNLSAVRFNFSMNNIFTIADKKWAGIDPESANARVPNLPTYTTGVSIIF